MYFETTTRQYPVPFYVGQTAFSGEKIKAYFAYMLERDTLVFTGELSLLIFPLLLLRLFQA